MGHKAFSRVQLGREETPGTLVSGNKVWRGEFVAIKDARETQMVAEDIGVALPSNRMFTGKLLAEMSFPATPFTPEQGLHVFEAGIKSVGSGTADGTSSTGYVYTYPFGLTAASGYKTYSIETGDEDRVEAAEYGFVNAFEIKAERGGAVEISADWTARQAASIASFGSGAETPTVTQIPAANGTIYINDNTGAFGASQVAVGNILEVTLAVKTGLVPLFTVDSGSRVFQSHYFNKDEFDAELTMKWVHNASSFAEKDKWRDDVPRLVRLDFKGSEYASTGLSNTLFGGHKGLRIDFPGAYTEFAAFEHDEGKSVIVAKLKGGYDPSSGSGLTIYVANEASAI